MRRLNRVLVGMAGVLLATVAAATAQDRGVQASYINRQTVDPSLQSTVKVNPDHIFNLSATKEETSVKANFGVSRGPWSFSTVLTGPIDEKAEQAQLASLDGLENGFRVQAGLTFTLWKWDNPMSTDAVCKEYWKAAGVPPAAVCADDIFVETDKVGKARAALFKDRFDSRIEKGNALFFSAIAKANRRSFSYVDEALKEMEDDKTGRSFTLGLGWLSKSDHFFSLSYRDEASYSAGSSSEICSPINEDLVFRCRDLVLTAPGRMEREVAGFEYRRFISDDLALSPRFLKDVKNNVESIEIPLYFLKNGDGALIGGITVGWRSDTDDVTAVAFVGTSLGLAN